MSENEIQPGIEMLDVLRRLGFRQHSNGEDGYLTFDFGNFQPTVFRSPNRWFVDVVHVMGVVSDPRSLSQFEGELPVRVVSMEEGMGWLAWLLDYQSPGRHFRPLRDVPWLEQARHFKFMVPMERDRLEYEKQQAALRAEYEAAPSCQVDRRHLRVVLTELWKAAPENPERVVTLNFDGTVLSLAVGNEVHRLVATGSSWTGPTEVLLQQFGATNRLRDGSVDIRVFATKLKVGDLFYPLAPKDRVPE